MEVLIQFFIGVLSIVFFLLYKIYGWSDWFILFTLLSPVISPFVLNIKDIKFKFQILLHINKNVRVSMAYVYRICIDDEYLLVQNSHRKNSYQFVGGKYKYFEQAVATLSDFKMQPDDKLKQTESRKNDMAFYIPARNLNKFVVWHETGINRDIDCTREFREELLQAKKTSAPLLDAEFFTDVKFRKVCTVKTPVIKSSAESGWGILEFKQYDVLEPMFTEAQINALKELKQNYKGEYVKWVTKSEINSLGHKEGSDEKKFSINEHTKWCLNEKYSKY